MTPRRRAALVTVVLALGVSTALHAHLLFGIRWLDAAMPIRYYVTNRDVTGVTALQLQATADRSFASWTSVPNVTARTQFGGFVTANPGSADGASVIGFLSQPDLDRVLGATTFQYDTVTGVISESDIFLNSIFPWTVADIGDPSRYDVQSVLTHEIGHLLGLGHSALGETQPAAGGGRTILGKRAVMFPIAYPRGNLEDRTLEADDISGVADVYGNSDSRRTLGQISGRVTLNGGGILGAHVTAFNPSTGSLYAGYTLDNQGRFVIGGMPVGLYIVRVEPLDDIDLDSVFDDDTVININFKPAFYTKQVAVPAGGSGPSIEIKVRAK